LRGQLPRMAWLGIPAVLGGLLGAGLLLVLSQRIFRAVVPVLIVAAVALVVIQPWLTGHIRRAGGLPGARVLQPLAVFGTAVYGGYFGAAQGVILMSFLSLLVEDTLQRLNALKNVFAAIVNFTAAAYFVIAAHVDWPAAALIAVSSTVGAQAGAAVGRRLSPLVLRAVIVVAGLAAVVKLVT
ncbi:MAG: sulfite exporter TauE/SafE family protein, partial [Candidatus Dormibacteraeota bacterium]|nr:sulfite exporter TauE/SafE family protein [Candidatus Dormibacteraeota bacterium]